MNEKDYLMKTLEEKNQEIQSLSNLELEFDHVPKHSWGLDGEEFNAKTDKYVFSIDKSTEILIPDKNVKKLTKRPGGEF